MTVQLVQTSPFSEEYGQIEYELQLQLKAPKLVIRECYELGIPRAQAEFQAYCKNCRTPNVVDVFIQTSDIHQYVADIAANGIKVDTTNGFKFRTGSFEVDKDKEMIEVIRLQIALGLTLNFEKSEADLYQSEFAEAEPTQSCLKQGYDSLCVSDKHDFVVFNPHQIKTCNLVRFEGGKNLESVNNDDCICDLCNKEPATVWCVNDSAKLCAECDQSSHSINKIMQKHKRVSMDDARVMMEFCPVHSDERVEYYCPVCQAPVCIICKMNGSHSQGEKSTHPLIPLRAAYCEAIEHSKKNDDKFDKKIELLDERLKNAEEKMNELVANAEEMEKEITRRADAAIKQLKSILEEKALLIKSAKTEILRKKEELLDNSHFLETEKNSVGPLLFLRAYSRHHKLAEEFNKLDDIQPELPIEADSCVEGSLTVKSDSSAKPITNKVSAPETPVSRDIPSPNFQSNSIVFNENNSKRNYSPNRADFSTNSPSSFSISASPKQQSMSIPPAKQSFPTESTRSSFPPFSSLMEIARRKLQKLEGLNLELNFQPFQGSSILTDLSMATQLYLCFPFKSLPHTYLLFSSERDGRSIAKMHQKIDEIGISAVIVRNASNRFIFGGFAAAKWNNKGIPFGNKSSGFLFNLTRDAFIPYRPQINDACYLYATENTLTFGKYDLILADDFDRCSAVIENSYGIGLQHGSRDAQAFLAGEPQFVADVVEVWGFFTSES